MKIRWKLLFSIACLLVLGACDTATTLSEDPPEEDNRLLPVSPSAQWVYDYDNSHGAQVTIKATGQKRAHHGEAYDVLSVTVDRSADNIISTATILTRETEEGLNLVELYGDGDYHEFFFKYPIEIHEDSMYSAYTYSFEEAGGSTFTRDVTVRKERVTVPAGEFECLKYVHRNDPELWIMQYCLVPGVGFVKFHYRYGTYFSELASFTPGGE